MAFLVLRRVAFAVLPSVDVIDGVGPRDRATALFTRSVTATLR